MELPDRTFGVGRAKQNRPELDQFLATFIAGGFDRHSSSLTQIKDCKAPQNEEQTEATQHQAENGNNSNVISNPLHREVAAPHTDKDERCSDEKANVITQTHEITAAPVEPEVGQ
jgi:hypothetical protein